MMPIYQTCFLPSNNYYRSDNIVSALQGGRRRGIQTSRILRIGAQIILLLSQIMNRSSVHLLGALTSFRSICDGPFMGLLHD